MTSRYYKNKFFSFFSFCAIFLLSACGSTKNVPYFQDINMVNHSTLTNTAIYYEPKIQPDDIISISIFTIDPNTSMIVNQVGTQAINSSIAGQSNNIGTSMGATQSNAGFLVDKNGEIDLSIVGKIKIAGLTTSGAKDLIKQRAATVFRDPNVQVRFANFKVTVLGEVGRPAAYTILNEKVTILDALGLAGDLTIYGKRENVLLIRDNNGQKEFARFNLNSSELFNNPFFYLKQNDVIYVEPNKGKAATLNQARTQTIAILGTALTVLITLISRI